MPNTRNKKNKDINKNQEQHDLEPVCFICLELEQPTNKIIKMKEMELLNSDCDCNSEIHINCLFDWVKVSKSCPICRKKITIHTHNYNKFDYYYRVTIMTKIKYNITIFINMCFMVGMMIIQYIAFLFLLNVLLRLSKEAYHFIIDKR